MGMIFLKILIDAFGGDHSPDEILRGVQLALSESASEFILCGNEKIIKERMAALSIPENPRISIMHAETKIEGNDEPVLAIRKKKDSSMVVGLEALKEGIGDAFVSAGNTGALFAGATLLVKRIKGIKRAAISSVLPTLEGPLVLIDTGANVTLRPEYYPQMALMGSAFYSKLFKEASPTVGLINIGDEETKGTETVLEAYNLLKETKGINFIGNFEARNLLAGGCQVAVCDGWTGNIALKSAEGTAKVLTGELKKMFTRNLKTKLAAGLLLKQIGEFSQKFNYKEYGGAPIIGVEKPILKAHGNSDAKTFSKAIVMAEKFAASNVIEEIKAHINNNE